MDDGATYPPAGALEHNVAAGDRDWLALSRKKRVLGRIQEVNARRKHHPPAAIAPGSTAGPSHGNRVAYVVICEPRAPGGCKVGDVEHLQGRVALGRWQLAIRKAGVRESARAAGVRVPAAREVSLRADRAMCAELYSAQDGDQAARGDQVSV